MGVSQVVEHLPAKCKTLSSNPGVIKKRKNMNVISKERHSLKEENSYSL
jgi:hypothetical protein